MFTYDSDCLNLYKIAGMKNKGSDFFGLLIMKK